MDSTIYFNDYQAWTRSTAVYDDTIYPVLGLAEEAGEVAGKIGKAIRDDTDVSVMEITKELGDVLWMVARIADDMGITLQDIVDMNVDKLESRKTRGVLQGSGDNR